MTAIILPPIPDRDNNPSNNNLASPSLMVTILHDGEEKEGGTRREGESLDGKRINNIGEGGEGNEEDKEGNEGEEDWMDSQNLFASNIALVPSLGSDSRVTEESPEDTRELGNDGKEDKEGVSTRFLFFISMSPASCPPWPGGRLSLI